MSVTPAQTSAGDSAERGRSARLDAPRGAHGEWAPAADRSDPVEILVGQASSRVPELVPIRYGRMLVSPFTFFRGGAAIMAADLAGTPDIGVRVQLCGDAHISNFGAFGTPDRSLIFGLNDFDETLPGPWEWDLKRMVASIEIAGRDREFSPDQCQTLVRDAVREYREGMRAFAGMGNLDVWYARMEADQIAERFGGVEPDHRDVKALRRTVAKARSKDSLRAITKLTHRVDGQLRFLSAAPLIVPIEELLSPDEAAHVDGLMVTLLANYRESLPDDRKHLLDGFRYVHLARKVVGVGSVGTRAWVLLLEGRDGEETLVLQAKEAQESVLEPYLGPSAYANCGQRVVEGQRLLQAASDIFLGWERVPGVDGHPRDFYVRQLWDWKGSADISTMTVGGLDSYTKACAWTLARTHARSGDRVAIGAYLGRGAAFDKAIAAFAQTYANQNEDDYQAFTQAVADGRMEAQTGL